MLGYGYDARTEKGWSLGDLSTWKLNPAKEPELLKVNAMSTSKYNSIYESSLIAI